jgi:hypothetical protein
MSLPIRAGLSANRWKSLSGAIPLTGRSETGVEMFFFIVVKKAQKKAEMPKIANFASATRLS